MRDALLEFNCLGCQQKAHHPVLTRCGHLYWYNSSHTVGSAIIMPLLKPGLALFVVSLQHLNKSTHSSSKTIITKKRISNYLKDLHLLIFLRSPTQTLSPHVMEAVLTTLLWVVLLQGTFFYLL